MILAILQARMTSTRLPGKVMRDLVGAPMIQRQLERLRRAERIDQLVLATSLHRSDDPLAAWAATQDLPVHRGSLEDVLGRFVGALDAFGPAEQVMRLTADCPLADPTVIDFVIDAHLESGVDYTNNVAPIRTFAHGLDCEIMRAEVLRAAAAEAQDPYEREHVTPFIYRDPHRFGLGSVTQDVDDGVLRWTVDTPEDFAFVEAVYEGLWRKNPEFTSADVKVFVGGRPDLIEFGGHPRA